MTYSIYYGFILHLCLSACSLWTPKNKPQIYGIQDHYREYIPAKIAILPAQLWPQQNVRNSNYESNVEDLFVLKTAQMIDISIQKAFTHQADLETQTIDPKTPLLNELMGQWIFSKQLNHDKHDDQPLFFYDTILSHRSTWLNKLNQLAQETAYFDAVLIPFLYMIREDQRKDGGLFVSQRQLQLVLFLIDTPTGKLIWVKKRHIQHNHKDTHHFLEYPNWSILYSQLFVNHLWQAFPGMIRQS